MSNKTSLGNNPPAKGDTSVRSGPLRRSPTGLLEISTAFNDISPASSFLTPTNKENSYLTPTNQTIEVSYEKLGLTPTMKRLINDAIDAMRDDGFWPTEEEEFVLILFLYGNEYYKHLEKEARVKRIRECMQVKNRDRLLKIAISNVSDPSYKLNFLDYFYFAETIRLFFNMANTSGGFGSQIYYRSQGSKNCYIVAAVMFLTLKLQRDNPGIDVKPLDVGYIGRHYVIETQEGLEKRVIRDQGDNAYELVCKIIGNDYAEKFEVVHCDMTMTKQENFQTYYAYQLQKLNTMIEMKEVGLVSSFKVQEEFKVSTINNAQKGFGYWLFDGNSVDCEGKWVELTPDDIDFSNEEKVRLENLWNEKTEIEKNQRKAITKKFDELLGVKANRSEDNQKEQSKEEIISEDVETRSAKNNSGVVTEKIEPEDVEKNLAEESSFSLEGDEGLHAMILIGSQKVKVGRKEKTYYMIWNWWKNAPLILVSFDYLVACRCRIFFVGADFPPNLLDEVERCEKLACVCAFPDHAENTFFIPKA